MSFAKIIFQKDIYTITLADIENFFAVEQEETAILEFKSGEVGIGDINREVCAFLNSEGGLLIVGTPKEVKSSTGRKKVCKGTSIPSAISNKETLVRSIASNISPSPLNIKVHPIDHPEGKIFLIDVPQSLIPPHQVNTDGKYYIRLETEARAAPHGIVEALFFKRQKPDLNLNINVSFSKRDIQEFGIELSFENNSLYTAENLGYILKVEGITRFFKGGDSWSLLPVEECQIVHKDTPLGNGVLVNGVSFAILFSAHRMRQYIIIDCTYWCRDTQAHRIIRQYDIINHYKLINGYNSKTDDVSLRKDVYENYLSNNNDRRPILMSQGY